jgi:hypothetical protein
MDVAQAKLEFFDSVSTILRAEGVSAGRGKRRPSRRRCDQLIDELTSEDPVAAAKAALAVEAVLWPRRGEVDGIAGAAPTDLRQLVTTAERYPPGLSSTAQATILHQLSQDLFSVVLSEAMANCGYHGLDLAQHAHLPKARADGLVAGTYVESISTDLVDLLARILVPAHKRNPATYCVALAGHLSAAAGLELPNGERARALRKEPWGVRATSLIA